jgi:hypothetical protein
VIHGYRAGDSDVHGLKVAVAALRRYCLAKSLDDFCESVRARKGEPSLSAEDQAAAAPRPGVIPSARTTSVTASTE